MLEGWGLTAVRSFTCIVTKILSKKCFIERLQWNGISLFQMLSLFFKALPSSFSSKNQRKYFLRTRVVQGDVTNTSVCRDLERRVMKVCKCQIWEEKAEESVTMFMLIPCWQSSFRSVGLNKASLKPISHVSSYFWIGGYWEFKIS